MERSFKKEIIAGLIVILGSFILASGAIFWLKRDIEDRSGKIVGKRGLIVQQAGLTETIASLRANQAVAEAYRESLERLIPTKDDLFDFSKWLQSLAKNYGVGATFNFSGLEVMPTGEALGYVKFTLGVSGALQEISVFLRDLENRTDQFLTKFDSFSVKEVSGNYHVTVEGKVFFRD